MISQPFSEIAFWSAAEAVFYALFLSLLQLRIEKRLQKIPMSFRRFGFNVVRMICSLAVFFISKNLISSFLTANSSAPETIVFMVSWAAGFAAAFPIYRLVDDQAAKLFGYSDEL